MRLVSLDTAPTPPGGELRMLPVADDLALRIARWTPPDGVPVRGTVLLLHGFTEFIEKYYEVVEHLLARDLAVVSYDHRGQGLSGRLLPEDHPRRQAGYQTDFGELVADLGLVYESEVAELLPRPHLLVAHSMGGNVALRSLQEAPHRFDRAVLSAPMTGFDRLPLWLMRTVAGLQVGLGRGDRYIWGSGEVDLDDPVNRVTSDMARHARNNDFLRSEPRLATAGATWRMTREVVRTVTEVNRPERLRAIETPTLLVSPGRDLVVSPRSHARIAEHAPRVELAEVPEAMHEILQETDAIQERFWEAFDRFVEGGLREGAR